jgi:phosphoglycolate phosphatase
LSPSLILFDIDGTLVRRTGPHHRQALVQAVRLVTGLHSTTDGIPVHGMLDPDILTLMLRAAGIHAERARKLIPALLVAAEDAYLADVPDLRDRCCPGVPRLLTEFHTRQIPLALVTGNLTRIGWRKLERAGLHHYFAFGAFGEMAPTRGGLAKLAIERARAEGLIREDARISLIGDAPQDIRAAQENGIQSIAVRTGITPAGDLEECSPDYLLDDLTRLDLSIV